MDNDNIKLVKKLEIIWRDVPDAELIKNGFTKKEIKKYKLMVGDYTNNPEEFEYLMRLDAEDMVGYNCYYDEYTDEEFERLLDVHDLFMPKDSPNEVYCGAGASPIEFGIKLL